MIIWTRKYLLNKYVATLIVGIFMVTTFTCFAATTAGGHAGKISLVCETVMSLANNTIVQTGVVLLLLLATTWLSTDAGIFPTQSELNLRLTALHSLPIYRKISSREYSYLPQLFSSGIIHSKLHSIAD